MSQCALYCRQSKGESVQRFSVYAQVRALSWHVERAGIPLIPAFYPLGLECGAVPPGVFADTEQSAYTIPFIHRPAAQAVLKALKPGDAMFVLRMDRICRSMQDWCSILREFQQRQIRLIVADPMIDLSTADGRAVAQMLVAIAEWESAKKSERIKAALHAKHHDLPAKASQLHRLRSFVEQMDSEWRPRESAAEPAPVITGRIHTYIRCSSREQAKSGLGLIAQATCHARYREHLLANDPHLAPGEEIADVAKSAYEVDFRKRTGGKRLDSIVQRGDIVLIYNIDRGFRNTRDMVNLVPDWLARGVDIHFSSSGQKMSDPMSRMMATVLVQFAEAESALTSARTKEAKQVAGRQGRFLGGHNPVFWRTFDRKVNGVWQRRLMLDRNRLVGFRLLRLYMHNGMGRDAALNRLEDLLAFRERRPPIPVTGVYPGTSFAKLLSKTRRPDRYGVYQREWTRYGMLRAEQCYEEAIAEWRNVAAERRGRKALNTVRPKRYARLVPDRMAGEFAK